MDADRLASRIEPTLTKEFKAVWETMQQTYADLPLLTRILAERRSNLLHELPWQGLINQLYLEYRNALRRVFQQGGEAQFNELIRKAEKPNSFTMSHPEAERWARNHAAALVEGLTNETRIAMSRAIAEFLRLNIPPAEGARMLRSMLGLTPQYAQAVVNFQNGLRLRGFDAAYIQRKADEYSSRLLNHRARTVARTESMRAVQEGQRQAQAQAVEQGVLIANRTRRSWSTSFDERVCEICAPMDGQLTTLTEPWSTSVGPVQVPSDSHPQCRCQSVLVFPDATGRFPESSPRSGPQLSTRPSRSLRPKVKRG